MLMPKTDRALLARPQIRRLLVASLREAVRHGVDASLYDLAIFARPWNVDCAAVTASTLLWQGLEDHIVPPPATAFSAIRIPHARLLAMAGAGHFKGVGSGRAYLPSPVGSAPRGVSGDARPRPFRADDILSTVVMIRYLPSAVDELGHMQKN